MQTLIKDLLMKLQKFSKWLSLQFNAQLRIYQTEQNHLTCSEKVIGKMKLWRTIEIY